MGGGGKRDVHSFERYDRATGIAVFTSPAVKPGKQFLYFDPISALDEEHQWRWTQPAERRAMIDAALAK
jgi:lysine 2,3-aminomutase